MSDYQRYDRLSRSVSQLVLFGVHQRMGEWDIFIREGITGGQIPTAAGFWTCFKVRVSQSITGGGAEAETSISVVIL